MRFVIQVAASLLITASAQATAQSNLANGASDEASKLLVDRRIEAEQPGVGAQMAVWKAEVLKKVLTTWKRPPGASSARWIMRVKTNSKGQLLNLSWVEPTGVRGIDRSIVKAFEKADPYPVPPDPAAASAGIEFTDDATSQKRAELELASNSARNAAAIAKMQRAGPLQAYLDLVSCRYKRCELVANEWLDADNQRIGIAWVGFPKIEKCVEDEETALSEEVRLALKVAPAAVTDAIKDLHAYTVASLRALKNFDQSVVEARQHRAERSTGIDEKAARIALDL